MVQVDDDGMFVLHGRMLVRMAMRFWGFPTLVVMLNLGGVAERPQENGNGGRGQGQFRITIHARPIHMSMTLGSDLE
mgnify:CR=1 FL=1